MALFRLLLRHRAHAVLVTVLLAGCSGQSLFDNGDSDGDGDGDGDDAGPPTPVVPDARAEVPDAAQVNTPDGGVPDAGEVGPDAAPRAVCPAPCVGDAFGNFYTQQGGLNGRWRYVEIQPEQPDSPSVDMTSMVLPGGVPGWIGTGAQQPSIGACYLTESEPPCLELKDTVALTTPGNAPGAHHPGLMWIAPRAGLYALSGNWRVSSVAPEVDTTMRITRGDQSMVIHEETLRLTTTPDDFYAEVAVVAGGRIVLSATATTAESVSVGVDFFVTGPLIP